MALSISMRVNWGCQPSILGSASGSTSIRGPSGSTHPSANWEALPSALRLREELRGGLREVVGLRLEREGSPSPGCCGAGFGDLCAPPAATNSTSSTSRLLITADWGDIPVVGLSLSVRLCMFLSFPGSWCVFPSPFVFMCYTCQRVTASKATPGPVISTLIVITEYRVTTTAMYLRALTWVLMSIFAADPPHGLSLDWIPLPLCWSLVHTYVGCAHIYTAPGLALTYPRRTFIHRPWRRARPLLRPPPLPGALAARAYACAPSRPRSS